MEIRVLRRLEEKNQANADEIRALMAKHNACLINIMGGAGCGKTTLLEYLLPRLNQRFRCAVLEGDLFTTRDAERIAALDTTVVQLETQGACHLEAALVRRGLDELPLNDLDFVWIENVGNLVCPASFDLGEAARLAVVSVTEGHDKPSKYPLLFTRAQAVVISKTDLLAHTNFDMAAAEADIRKFNTEAPIFEFTNQADPRSDLYDWVVSLRA
jgi:hydrogenase nickel incorporation protein HypB